MTSIRYDSRSDTWDHITRVRRLVRSVIRDLQRRHDEHDQSKLEEPELSVFDEVTPRLRELTYGSEAYRESLAEMGVALTHHYKHNDHHPEHFPRGIADMNLVQVIEMLCDWKAATLRHRDGDIYRSIELNAERFGYGPQFKQLLLNTVPLLEGVT